MTHLLPLLFALAAPAATAEEPKVLSEKEMVAKDNYVLRISLPTEEDFALWRSPGLRIALGYAYGRFYGPAYTNFAVNDLVLRPDFRIDDEWSLAATCTYSIAGRDLSGLRWSVSLEPTWHPWRGLALAVGVGYAGFLASRTAGQRYAQIAPGAYEPPANEPIPPARSRSALGQELLTSCEGSGLSSLARVEYLFVAGPLFASGPFLQRDWQYVDCKETFGTTDPDSGRPVETSQWWRHRGVSLGWWVEWR